MTLTVRENIFLNIESTLEAVTLANGYDNTIVSVQRWRLDGNPLLQVPCVVISAGAEEKDPRPNPFMTCRLTVFIDIWARQDASDPQPTDAILNSLIGDIEKAIYQDVTRGGYAKDTNIKSFVPFQTKSGQPMAGMIGEIEIIYQHKQGDTKIAG